MPATARIELAQIGEQPMHRGIEVGCLLGDPLAQLLQLAIHDDCISSRSDNRRRAHLDATAAMKMSCHCLHANATGHGAFSGNVRLGVAANLSGAMRVHLWSTHRDHQQTLQSIERDVLAGSIAVPDPLGPLRTRPAEKGDPLYLEFAWHRSGPYLREIDRVEASIRWFVGTAKHRFR
jgi:hypothetical protein